MIKDSGECKEFDTGAVRDMHKGKGDMYSLPAAAILRLSKHYEEGAGKYGQLNYQKGIPISSFMDSALRHIFKYLDGWDDEDHLGAAAFNILGAIQMEERNPQMQDISARHLTKPYHYKPNLISKEHEGA
jgi:hypothetical protein